MRVITALTMRVITALTIGFVLAGPLAAAQGPVLSRDLARPGNLSVDRLDKDKPFCVLVQDLVSITLDPQHPDYMPYVQPSGMKIMGIPGLRTVVTQEPYTLEWDTAGFAPGIYRLKAVTILPNGTQLIQEPVEVLLMSGEPVKITVPESPSAREKIPVKLEAVKGNSIRRVELMLDGYPVGDVQSLPGQVTLEPERMSGGPHTLMVRSTDSKGREYLSRPVEFSVPELVRLVEPTDGLRVSAGPGGAEVRFRAEHSLGDTVKAVEFYCDGQKVGEVFRQPLEFVWRQAPLSPGFHQVSAVALEETGAVFRSRAVTIEAVRYAIPIPTTRANVTARITPAVVLVEVEGKENGEERSAASGFFVHESGYVVTSRHVTDGADKIYVTTSRGKRLLAKVAAQHPTEDVAVLKVAPGNYEVMPLGKDSDAKVGLEIGVAGYPFATDLRKLELGVVPAFNYGTISAIRPTRDRAGAVTSVIQFDARISPGQSGGPVFPASGDAAGKVIGIVRSGLISDTMGATGINLAVRVDVLRNLLAQSRVPFHEE